VGTLLTVAVATGIGAWQLVEQGGGTEIRVGRTQRQAAARTNAAQREHIGGMAELYRDQAQRASSAP
jgi:hypothetical protein